MRCGLVSEGLTCCDQLHVKGCEHMVLSTIGLICMALGILIKPLQDLLDRILWSKHVCGCKSCARTV